jgi:hypothetical protein
MTSWLETLRRTRWEKEVLHKSVLSIQDVDNILRDSETLKRFIELGLDVNIPIEAVGNVNMLSYLMFGTQRNFRLTNGRRFQDDLNDVVRMAVILIHAGIDIDYDKGHQTALGNAIWSYVPQLVMLLVKSGADLENVWFKESALDLAKRAFINCAPQYEALCRQLIHEIEKEERRRKRNKWVGATSWAAQHWRPYDRDTTQTEAHIMKSIFRKFGQDGWQGGGRRRSPRRSPRRRSPRRRSPRRSPRQKSPRRSPRRRSPQR